MPEAFRECRGWAWTVHKLEDAQKAETHIGCLISASLSEIGLGHFLIDPAAMALELSDEPYAPISSVR